jgi:hypothetical protein
MDPVQQLVEIEAIKQLKARYMRSVDTKAWADLAATFTPDACCEYSDGKFRFEGRDAIIGFLSESLGSKQIATMHQSHTPEIEVTSESTARGTWYFEDVVINPLSVSDRMPHGTVLHGTGIYHDEYVKQEGAWQISLTGYERIFEFLQPRDPNARLRTRWDTR